MKTDEDLDAFSRWLAEGPKRAPKLYGAPGTTNPPTEAKRPVFVAPKAIVEAPKDFKSAAAGEKEDEWDAAEVVEDEEII